MLTMLEEVQMSTVMELWPIYSVTHITPHVKACTYVAIHTHTVMVYSGVHTGYSEHFCCLCFTLPDVALLRVLS